MPAPQQNDTPTSNNTYCDEHKLVINQLDTLRTLPTAVSKMTGIVGLIGTLFVLLVGLAFNSHFENKRNNNMYNKKLDALSHQISTVDKLSLERTTNTNNKLIRVEIALSSVEKAMQAVIQTNYEASGNDSRKRKED